MSHNEYRCWLYELGLIVDQKDIIYACWIFARKPSFCADGKCIVSAIRDMQFPRNFAFTFSILNYYYLLRPTDSGFRYWPPAHVLSNKVENTCTFTSCHVDVQFYSCNTSNWGQSNVGITIEAGYRPAPTFSGSLLLERGGRGRRGGPHTSFFYNSTTRSVK